MIQASSLLAIMLISGIALSGGEPADQFNMTEDSLQEDVRVMGNIGDDSLDRNSTDNFKDFEQPGDDFQKQNSTEIIEAVDLPADPFTLEMVEELRHVLEENKISSRTIVSYSSTQHSYRCSWVSGRCYYANQYPVHRREYYLESYPVWVPAPEWTNGCPAYLIRCCGGYGRFNDQCLSYDEVSHIFRLQRLYPKYDFLCSMLGMCGGNPYSRCGHTEPPTPEPGHRFPPWNRNG